MYDPKQFKKYIDDIERNCRYSFEYNRYQEGSEPYYPVNTTNDKVLYEQYKKNTDNITNLLMAGRLGQYKYYNMDKAIEAAMELVPEIEEKLV